MAGVGSECSQWLGDEAEQGRAGACSAEAPACCTSSGLALRSRVKGQGSEET